MLRASEGAPGSPGCGLAAAEKSAPEPARGPAREFPALVAAGRGGGTAPGKDAVVATGTGTDSWRPPPQDVGTIGRAGARRLDCAGNVCGVQRAVLGRPGRARPIVYAIDHASDPVAVDGRDVAAAARRAPGDAQMARSLLCAAA